MRYNPPIIVACTGQGKQSTSELSSGLNLEDERHEAGGGSRPKCTTRLLRALVTVIVVVLSADFKNIAVSSS